jgi:hypothetical protein
LDRRVGGREVPVPAPVGQHLEQQPRLDQDHPPDLQATLEKRPKRDLDVEGGEIRHEGFRAAFDIAEPHLLDGQRRTRQHRQADRAVDLHGASGLLAELGDDPRLQRLPVDERRGDQHACHDDHD